MKRLLIFVLLSALYAGGGRNSKLAWDSSGMGERFVRQRDLRQERDKKVERCEKPDSSPALSVTPEKVAEALAVLRLKRGDSIVTPVHTPTSAKAEKAFFPISEE